MYGMMPSAPTAQCSKAPPVKRLYIPKTPPPAPLWACFSKNFVSATPSKPGTRTNAISRQIVSNNTVNQIRDLNSGILKQFLNVLVMAAIMGSNQVYDLAGAADLRLTTSHVPPLASIFALA